jgi:predicted phage tail protein
MLKFRGGSPSKQKSIPDSFKSRDTFELIMGLGEGPWWGPKDGARSLYIDQTPIVGASGMSNFTNISLTFYPGSALGEVIKPRLGGFSSPIEVSVGMTKDLPITRDGVQTNIDWVELRLVVQGLATETDDGVRANQAQVKIEWKKLSSPTWTNAILYQEPAPQTDLGPAGAQASYVVYDPNDVTEAIGTPVVAQSTMPGEPGNKFLIWLDDANGHQPYVWDTETDTWVSDANAVGDNWEFTNPSTGTTNTVYVNPVAIPPYVPYDVTVTYPPGTFIGRALRSFNGAAMLAANPGISYLDGVLYINDKITSAVVRELRFAVENTSEVLEYRFTKLTADTAGKKTSELAIESIQEVKANDYTFPNTAMLQVVGQGNDQISGNPTFQGIYKMRIVKVPSNFDPITSTYDGIWDGTYQMAWTRSVPWIFMDFVENSTFGLSKIFPHVCDKWKIYAWAQHADALVDNGRGGTRPRWTFNHVQKDKIDAKEFAQVIASAGGARYTDDGNGLVTVFFESIDEPVVAQFTNENVTGAAFRYSSTDRLTRSNQVTGRFKNPDLFYRDDTRTVVNQDDIDVYGTIPEEFEAVGCRDISELQARARYRLVTSLTEKRYVNFQTHRKGRYLAPWQLIAVCDQDASYGLSGTVTEKTGARTVLIREPVALEPGYTYLLKVDTVNPDYPATSDQQYKLWEYEIVNEAGTHSSLTVDADLPDLPEFCTFSLGNADTIGVPKIFRVHKITEVDGDPDQVQITALICNRTKWTYIDGGTTTLPADDSRPYYNGRVEAVTTPRIDFTTVTTGVISTLNAKLSWDKSTTAYVSKYKVYDSVNDGPSIDIGETNTNQYLFENFTLGQHALTIVPIDFMGRAGPATVLRVDSTGELRPVQKVTNLRLSGGGSTFTGTSAVVLWDDAAPDTSFSHYLVEVLETATDDVLRTEAVTAREWTYDFDKIRSDGFVREVTVVVHVVDLVGNVSDGVEKSISNPAPAAPTLTLVEMPGGVEVRLSTPTDPDFIGYKVWASATTGFTPNDATNLIFKGSTPPVLSGTSGDTIYVRAAAYDQFGETGLNVAAEQSATYGSLDAVAITGTIETSQIADLAISAAKVAAGAIETAKLATGAVTSNELGAAAVIAGKIGALAVGTADIAALAITAAKIGGSAVGNTKIAAGAVIAGKYGALSLASGDIAASAIIAGKYSAGSIVSADVSAGGIQTANIAALAVTASEVAAAAIVTSKLATGAVTSNELGAAAVITSKLAALAVTSAELAAGSVVTAKIGALAVTAAEVAAGAIVTAKLATGAVTSNELGAAAVVNAKLATDAVQSANIQAAAVIAGKFGALAIASGDIAAGAVVTAKIGSAAVTATELGLAAVTNAKIATDAVQSANIQAAAVIAGKFGALAIASGDVAAGAIITAKLATGAVTSNELGASSVISTKIGALAVGSGALAAGAVIAGKYGALSLASADIAAGAVIAGKYGALSVAAADVAAGAIITSKLATGAVTATELGAAAVTNAKIATDAVQSAQIQAAAVVAGKIGALAIASGDIAAGAVIAGKFGALSIAAADVAAGAIITAKLAAGAVTATELGAAAVTNAKIATDAVQAAQIQAAAVVAGKIGALAIASGDIAAGAIITAKIGALAVTTATIAASAVTATELGAAAVTTAKINAAAVTTTELGALAVTGAKIAAAAITAAKIAAGTITATEIAAGTITASLIAAGTITAASIAAGTITATQIAAGTIVASNIAVGTIVASKLALIDTQNLIPDGAMIDSAAWNLTGNGSWVANQTQGFRSTGCILVTDSGASYSLAATTTQFPVDQTKTYRFSVQAKAVGAGTSLIWWRVHWYDAAGAAVNGGVTEGLGYTSIYNTSFTATTLQEFGADITPPATAVKGEVRCIPENTTSTRNCYFGGLSAIVMANAELIVDGSITAVHIAADTITATQIAASAISSSELAAGAVIAGKITAGTIVAADIAATTITAAKITAGTITTTQIAAGTITASNIAAGTITANEIAGTTITAAKIVSGTITTTEIAAGTITAANISAGAITASKIYVTDNSNMCGDVNFQDTTMWTVTGGWAFDTSTDITTSLNAPKGMKLTATGANPQATSNMIFGDSVRYISVEPSKAYRVTLSTLTKTGFNGYLQLVANWYDQAGTFINGATVALGSDFRFAPAASNVKSSLDGIVTSHATAAYVGFYVTNSWPAAAASAGVACVAVPRVHRAASGELIVDGAIIAAKLAAGSVVAGKIAAGTIVAADIAATTITAAKIVAGTITTTEIAAGTITASDITAGTITANEIAATTITAAKIVSGTITTTQIAAGTITASNIAAGTITATLIAAGTITASKLLMTDFTNLTADPYGLNSSEWSYSGTIPLWNQTTTHATAPAEVRLSAVSSALVTLQRFAANNGDTFRVKIDTKASADATADLILTVWSYDKLDGFLASHQASLNNIGTSWVGQSAVITVANASAAYVRIGVFCNGLASGYVSLTDMYFTRANAAELIVDGSIVAGQIAADTITAAQIAAGAISATELAANAVIAGKIAAGTIVAADIAANTITAAKITAGTITTTEIAAGTITASDIAAGTITATQIAADTITASQIAANAITATELAANAVIAGKIAAGTIVAADIAATTITAAKIVAGTITTAEIAAGTIVASDIAAGTITANEIAATTITAAKIVSGTITTTQIAAGTITAANIAADTITASRMVVTDTSNMVNDAEFNEAIGTNNSWSLGSAGAVTLVTSDALVTALQGSKVAKITGLGLADPTIRWNYIDSNYARIPVEPGKPYFCSVDYAVTAGFNGSIYADLRFLNSAGTDAGYDTLGTAANYHSSAAGSTITGTFSEIIVAPATAVVVIYRLIVDWNTDFATRDKGGTAGFTRPRMRRAANGELIVDGTIVATKIAADTITATQIAAGAIAASELAANAVIAGKIAAGTIVAADIAATTITAAKIVAGTITTTEIAANTIVAADIAAGTITATQIASSTITATQIAAGTITASLIAAGTIVASNIAAGTITTNKLLMSDFANLTEDPYGASSASWSLSNASVNQTTTHTVAPSEMRITAVLGSINSSSFIPAKAGDTFRIKCDMRASADAAADVQLAVWQYNAAGTFLTSDSVLLSDIGTTWSARTAIVTCNNAACVKVKIGFYVPSMASGYVSVTNAMFRRAGGAELIVDGSIAAGHIAADTITATQIAAGAIAASELAANAVIAGKIAAGTIVAADIAATTITAAKIVAGTLTATEIAATTITAAKIVSGTITTTQIAATTIVAGNIAAGTITATQIAAGTITATQIAAGTITATQIAAGTIDATKITVSSLSALSANLGAITAGTLALTSGSYVVYEGAGFGASSDLVLWFGLASTAMGAATKTNGLFSLANDGIIRQGAVNVTQANAVLSASFSPAYVSTTHSTSTPLSQAVTVTPTGGSGSYNYVWSVSTVYSGAVPTLSAPYAATCTIGVTHNAIGTIDGIIQCLITDTGTGKTVTKYWAYYSEGTGGGDGAGGGGGLPP